MQAKVYDRFIQDGQLHTIVSLHLLLHRHNSQFILHKLLERGKKKG